jgi:hypothetical protein
MNVPRKSLGRKVLLGLGIAFIAAAILFVAYGFVFIPLKFRYLIYRVESARTAKEEHWAFQLAADWGSVWSFGPLDPKYATANGGQISGDWHLTWLESSPFGGPAYEAFRTIIDTNNVQVLEKSCLERYGGARKRSDR